MALLTVAHGLPIGSSETAAAEGSAAATTPAAASLSFSHAFVASASVIIISELGDKTFFIAAIMAMRHARFIIFAGAISALGLMTVLSAYVGHAATIIPRIYTVYISTALFVFFGLKLLKEGYYMDPNEGQEELEEVALELNRKEQELSEQNKQGLLSRVMLSPVFAQAFVMTFLAEWGDRSQIATIILGAREDPFGVTVGGVVGHALCTMLAVIGGRLVAQRISVRSVHLIGGVVFLLFAVAGLLIEES